MSVAYKALLRIMTSKILDEMFKTGYLHHETALSIIDEYPDLCMYILPYIKDFKTLMEIDRRNLAYRKDIAQYIQDSDITTENLITLKPFLQDRSIRDIIFQNIRSSESALLWRLLVDHEANVKDLITEPKHAYQWALHCPDDRPIMIDRITDSHWAYRWGRDIGDRDIMASRITESRYAVEWAIVIRSHLEEMRSCVTDLYHMKQWLSSFPNDQDYFRINASDEEAIIWLLDTYGYCEGLIEHIHSSRYAVEWAIRYPDDSEGLMSLVTESKDATNWILKFPEDIHKLLHLVTDAQDVYEVACLYPEKRMELIYRIGDEDTAYDWCMKWPEDLVHLRDRFKTPIMAFVFAIHNPDQRHFLRHLIVDPFWYHVWKSSWPNDSALLEGKI